MSDKALDRLAKLLTQAERAEEGSPERAAFMERAIQQSQIHNLDLAVARAHQVKKEKHEEPEDRTFNVGPRATYSASKANEHFVDLMRAIGHVYDIQMMIGHNRQKVFGTGMPSDLDFAEKLFTLLAPQMVAEADAQLKAGANKTWKYLPKTKRVEIPDDERAWGQWTGKEQAFYDDQQDYFDALEWVEEINEINERRGSEHRVAVEDYTVWSWEANRDRKLRLPPTTKIVEVWDDEGKQVFEHKEVSTIDARHWRANFYQAFIQRTEERLREAKRKAMKAAGVDMDDENDKTALVLADKAKIVREDFERRVLATHTGKGTYSGAEIDKHDYSAQAAGATAAKRAVHGDEMEVHG